MIFDCDYVTDLVKQWQRTQDDKILELIVEKSLGLVEAVVSSYDYIYRDDLIQECCMRLQYASQFFDPEISNLHTYYTTVIKNTCLTYIRKQERYMRELDIDLSLIGEADKNDDEDILTSLIARNRARFPSLIHSIDDITEYIFTNLTYNARRRHSIVDMEKLFSLSRQVASVVYDSTVMYLRMHYNEFAVIQLSPYDSEFSIIKDIEDLFGNIVADRLAKVLTGMTIRFP